MVGSEPMATPVDQTPQDFWTGLTTLQSVQRDQANQSEYFRSTMMGWGMLGAVAVVLLYYAWKEWR